MSKPYKHNRTDRAHPRLIRAAVLAIQDLRSAMDGKATPEAAIMEALETLTNGLHGQRVRDEQVTIRITSEGKAVLESKSEFVEVKIVVDVL
jgi:hypothetical protein